MLTSTVTTTSFTQAKNKNPPLGLRFWNFLKVSSYPRARSGGVVVLSSSHARHEAIQGKRGYETQKLNIHPSCTHRSCSWINLARREPAAQETRAQGQLQGQHEPASAGGYDINAMCLKGNVTGSRWCTPKQKERWTLTLKTCSCLYFKATFHKNSVSTAQ